MGMSAEAMNEIFRNSVNAAQECAKKTKDEGQKGIIYATLALAMANTGVINVELGEVAELAPKTETKREDLKPKAERKAVPKMEKPAVTIEIHHGSEDDGAKKKTEPEKKPESKKAEVKPSEPVFGAEWTDEALEYFAEETNYVQEFQSQLYDYYLGEAGENGMTGKEAEDYAMQQAVEFLNENIEKATVGTCHTDEDINPMNIKYIVEYLKAVERGEEPADGAYLPV